MVQNLEQTCMKSTIQFPQERMLKKLKKCWAGDCEAGALVYGLTKPRPALFLCVANKFLHNNGNPAFAQFRQEILRKIQDMVLCGQRSCC